MTLSFLHDARTGRLLRRARTGDREAFRALYRALYPRVWSYLARRTRVREECEDLTSHTFEKLFERMGQWDESRGSASAFVLGIARHLLFDELRKAQLAQRSEASPTQQELIDRATPHSLLEQTEELNTLRHLLDKRPAALREMLTLRYADGLSHREIASLLAISEAAVKQRLSRAMRDLRREANHTQVHDTAEGSPSAAQTTHAGKELAP